MTATIPMFPAARMLGPQSPCGLVMGLQSLPWLRARLRSNPSHPRALSTSPEALALWLCSTSHTAPIAGTHSIDCGPNRLREAFPVCDAPPRWLAVRTQDPRRGSDAMGVFGDRQPVRREQGAQ